MTVRIIICQRFKHFTSMLTGYMSLLRSTTPPIFVFFALSFDLQLMLWRLKHELDTSVCCRPCVQHGISTARRSAADDESVLFLLVSQPAKNVSISVALFKREQASLCPNWKCANKALAFTIPKEE